MARKSKIERNIAEESFELVLREIDEDLAEQLAFFLTDIAVIRDEEKRRKFITTMQLRENVENFWAFTPESIHDFFGMQVSENERESCKKVLKEKGVK